MSIKGFEVGGVQQQYDYTALDNIPANLVQDANYVHTDNNYTNADKTKLSGIEAQANKTTIDATLTHSGQAADAKATGDAISALDAQVIASMPHDTASGSIASFPDGAVMPVIDCSVAVAPNQNLNGYDNPWPAGGGKNLYPTLNFTSPYTVNGVKFTRNADGSVSIKGTATAQADCSLWTGYNNGQNAFSVEAGTYTISATGLSLDVGLIIGGSENTSGLAYTDIRSSPKVLTVTLNAGTTGYNLFRVSSGATVDTTVYIQWEKSSTATSYAPYSNICPISGWTECKVYVSPTTDPDDATVYTIDLDGTRYGGTLDVLTGVLTVDKFLYVYDGTESFNKSSTALNGFYNELSAVTPHNWPAMQNYNNITTLTDEKASMLVCTRNANTYKTNYGYCYFDSGHNFNVPPETFGTTVDSFKAKLAELYSAGTPLSVFCKIATPQAIQLTGQQIATFLGTNNIFADCGDTTVDYYADTTLFVNKKIAAAVAALS